MRCLFCSSEQMEVKNDKRGRPYLTCSACSVRVFARSIEAVTLYIVVAELLDRTYDWGQLKETARLRLANAVALSKGEAKDGTPRQSDQAERRESGRGSRERAATSTVGIPDK